MVTDSVSLKKNRMIHAFFLRQQSELGKRHFIHCV